MEWIFFSPHFDDVALSCGGFVWELTTKGDRVTIWTICAGEPVIDTLSPFAMELHKRWGIGGEVVRQRKNEDVIACQRIGAIPRYFQITDCIYRQDKNGSFLYPSEDSIFGDMHQEDQYWIDYLRDQLSGINDRNIQIVCPLAIGRHIDHRLVRKAVEILGKNTLYYADYPYVLKHFALQIQWKNQDLIPKMFQISEGGLTAWIEAVAAYTSQISSFWDDQASMERAIRDYAGEEAKIRLWEQKT